MCMETMVRGPKRGWRGAEVSSLLVALCVLHPNVKKLAIEKQSERQLQVWPLSKALLPAATLESALAT